MNFKRVKDVFEIKKGKKVEQIEAFKEGCIRYIQIDDLRNNKNIKFCDKEKHYTIANSNDIIIAWDGANAGTIGYSLDGAIGSTLAVLKKKDNRFNSEYCGLFLRSKFPYLRDKCTGATIPHISRCSLENIEIPDLDIEKQKTIVNTLNLSQELIYKRKNQIVELDELIKSKFIEMCADGANDYEKWEKLRIEEIAEKKKGSMRTGPFGSALLHSEFVEEGVFVLGIDNAVDNRFTWSKMRYITDEKYEKLKNYTVFSGDIIITIMGTVGRSAVIPENFPKAINTKHLACITLNKSIANPYFISYCIHEHPYVMQQLKKQSKGAIMDGLNLTIIKAIKVPLPPIEVQEEFVLFMKQVDKLKFEMENSLRELEDNFNSLMQKAFKGELFK